MLSKEKVPTNGDLEPELVTINDLNRLFAKIEEKEKELKEGTGYEL